MAKSLKEQGKNKRVMTLIIGARCKDGVVLVGDRKVTIGGGQSFDYSDKIFLPFTEVVMGSAGYGGLYKSFQNRILNVVAQKKPNTATEFLPLTEEVIREMHKLYDQDRNLILNGLDILMGHRVYGIAQLDNITPIGFTEGVLKYKMIGCGEPYAQFLVKTLWKQSMSMLESAKIFYFIINHIEEFELNNAVGGKPQVWFIPDAIGTEIPMGVELLKIREANETELNEMKLFSDEKIGKLTEFTHSLLT